MLVRADNQFVAIVQVRLETGMVQFDVQDTPVVEALREAHPLVAPQAPEGIDLGDGRLLTGGGGKGPEGTPGGGSGR